MANELGILIRKARKARGLKLRHVADAVGRGPSFVCDIEHGRRGFNLSPTMAVKLAEYLNIPVSRLFEASGIVRTPELEVYEKYLDVFRNQTRAIRCGESIISIRSAAKALRRQYPKGSSGRELLDTLDSSIAELETVLQVG